jgi:hypothetical protein
MTSKSLLWRTASDVLATGVHAYDAPLNFWRRPPPAGGPDVSRLRPLVPCLARAATAVIRVECDEGLVRVTAAKGPADLFPILMDAAGPQSWIGRAARPRNVQCPMTNKALAGPQDRRGRSP